MERSNSRGPDLKFWEHFSTYKYTILALSVVFLFFAMPLLDRAGQDFARFLFLMLLATVLWTLGLPRWLLTLCLVPGIMGFGFHLLIHNIDLSGAVFRVFEMGKMGTYTLFYGICLLIFLHRIFSETTVTIDSIQGGIAIYFLSGVFWAFLYQTLLLFDPDAILFSDHVVGAFSDLILFFFYNNDHSGLWGYNAYKPDGEKYGCFGSCLGTNLSGCAGCASGGIAFKWQRSIRLRMVFGQKSPEYRRVHPEIDS